MCSHIVIHTGFYCLYFILRDQMAYQLKKSNHVYGFKQGLDELIAQGYVSRPKKLDQILRFQDHGESVCSSGLELACMGICASRPALWHWLHRDIAPLKNK